MSKITEAIVSTATIRTPNHFGEYDIAYISYILAPTEKVILYKLFSLNPLNVKEELLHLICPLYSETSTSANS